MFPSRILPKEVEIIRRIPGELATGYQETAKYRATLLVLDLLSGSVMSDSLQPLECHFLISQQKVE